MKQNVIKFGPGEGLTGILSLPDQDVLSQEEKRPIAIILNAGVVHPSGPFRLHVDIATRLCELGFGCLRIDLSGLGDSAVRKDVVEGQNRASLDVADAMDVLEQETGHGRFVLIGLCSGAYNAHQIAVEDSRVVGCVFMDGLVYPTTGHLVRKTLRRVTSPRFVRNAIWRRILSDEIGRYDANAPTAAEFFELDKSAECVATEIERMLESGKQLLFTYTEGCAEISSRNQFREMFDLTPGSENLQVEYYQNFEHTFPLTHQRSAIVERIGDWFQDRFSSVALSCVIANGKAVPYS